MTKINSDAREFEKEALSFLRSIQLAVVAYYPYDHCSDIIGYLQSQSPFTIRSRVVVEILKTRPSASMVESFGKFCRDSNAERTIILSQYRIADLDEETRAQISESRIDYLDRERIAQFIKESGELGASLTPEEYAPVAYARSLPELSSQVIPERMRKTASQLGLEAWQMFEQGVSSVFEFCFGFTVNRLGKETLFKHEPEGLVLVQNQSNFAFIYECKTAGESYQMSADHELRYRDYIQEKKAYVKCLHNFELQYLVIVGPSFAGDVKKRRQSIHQKTGVLTIFLPARVLSELAAWACGLPGQVKRLIDLRQIFMLSEDEVSMETARKYMRDFEIETKNRY